MFEVDRQHDEVVVVTQRGLDYVYQNGVGTLVLSIKEARELSEKLLEATIPGTFQFVLTSTAVPDPEDG
jgi:hypothetical protein